MTQKDKIINAIKFAQSVKSMANRLAFDARDYGVQFPLSTANELTREADELLKKLTK